MKKEKLFSYMEYVSNLILLLKKHLKSIKKIKLLMKFIYLSHKNKINLNNMYRIL